jgi:hypothetical protein
MFDTAKVQIYHAHELASLDHLEARRAEYVFVSVCHYLRKLNYVILHMWTGRLLLQVFHP